MYRLVINYMYFLIPFYCLCTKLSLILIFYGLIYTLFLRPTLITIFHSSQYISRVFIKTEMTLKSKQVITGSRLVRSRSSDNLPTSQSQVNIQMMSHTLTIREVRFYPLPSTTLTLTLSDISLTGVMLLGIFMCGWKLNFIFFMTANVWEW